MAATDQHYRSQKTLDLVFGLSCGALLLTTVWMLVADYNREFKAVQRQFRDVEATLAEREAVDKLPDTDAIEDARKALLRARRQLEVGGARAALDREARETGDATRSFDATFALWRDPSASTADRLAAQKRLDAAHASFLANERSLKALREKADDEYRGIKADYDAQMSYWNIATDDAGKEPEGSARRTSFLKQAESIRKTLDSLEAGLEKARRKLDDLDARIKAEVKDVLAPSERAFAERDEEMKRLTGTFDRFAKLAVQKGWQVGDTIRALPILDGFASPQKIHQIWLPELTIDYGGFKDVPRYDRCTTCHLGIERASYTREALASLGDQDESRRLTTKLLAAQESLLKRQASGENLGFDPSYMPGERSGNLWLVLGLLLASSAVAAVSLGVLERSWNIGMTTLLACLGITALTGLGISVFAPVVPKVRDIKLTSGQITQFCAHPRLDLFVDANSPHPVEKFGCTTCHDGQGSATEFNLASHTPNDSVQEHGWQKKYGWKPSHYWDFPMLSRRFTESSCLKCHHQVTDLITKGAREEAPKLLKGYNILKDVGCFGCHEIQGLKGGRWIGPDLRLEPAPALDYLTPSEQERASADPANPPGTLRKVGPSLRRMSEKVSEEWARKWVLDPRGFREDTKMPHFYGLSTNHGKALEGTGQEKFPDVELKAIAAYLQIESQKALKGSDFYRESLLGDGPEFLAMKKRYDEAGEQLKSPKLDAARRAELEKERGDLAGRGASRPTRKGVWEYQDRLARQGLSDKDMKELLDLSRRFADLAILAAPEHAASIGSAAQRQRQLQDRLQEVHRQANAMRVRGEAESAVQAARDAAAGQAAELQRVTEAIVADSKPLALASLKGQVLGADYKPVPLPERKSDEKSLINGRRLFTEKGCLACHSHQGTTAPAQTQTVTIDGKEFNHKIGPVSSDANFGPELSRVHEKLSGEEGYRWLVQWILNPNVHHPRTRMPITHLTPAEAGEVASWLLKKDLPRTWDGKDIAQVKLEDMIDLARVYLGKAPGMTPAGLDDALPRGKDLSRAGLASVEGLPREADERILEKGEAGITEDSLAWYVGKKAIGRLGCYACHDIPGFETAKPIGTGLNDWGRKDGARLAFEDGEAYAKKTYNIVPTRTTRAEAEARVAALKAAKSLNALEAAELSRLEKLLSSQARLHELEHKKDLTAAEKDELHKLHDFKLFERDGNKPPFEQAFLEAMEHHSREGFLHLKLMDPRSYDYNRIRAWDDRLRMPQFKFARTRRKPGEDDKAFQARSDKEEAEAREAVMTFVLGLVAEPVPMRYVHAPKGEKGAEAAGRQVLDKYNCASCHQVRSGLFDFRLTPDTLGQADPKAGLEGAYEAAVGPDGKEQANDHIYPGHNAWTGPAHLTERMTAFGFRDAIESEKNDTHDVIFLTEALRYHDARRQMKEIPAGSFLTLPRGHFDYTPPYGGTWPDHMGAYLAQKDSTKFGTDQNRRMALPPPLVREGERVQPDWLYRFLLNPGVIRPESNMLLRMPKFNMSPEESRALVGYFAAVSKRTNPGAGVTVPYANIPQRDPEYWPRVSEAYRRELQRWAKGEGIIPAKEKEELEKAAKGKDAMAAKAAQERLDKLAQLVKDAAAQLDAADKDKDKGVLGDVYARNAFALIGNKELCVKCHNVGDRTNIQGPQGPNLALTAERLRPEWVEKWVAHPQRMFTYSPTMPQNFKNNPDPLKWEWQKELAGHPLQQTRAVRDLLMDSRRLSELLPTYTPPKAPDPGEKKKP
jgi:mono/diheme cytochrome c family protein